MDVLWAGAVGRPNGGLVWRQGVGELGVGGSKMCGLYAASVVKKVR